MAKLIFFKKKANASYLEVELPVHLTPGWQQFMVSDKAGGLRVPRYVSRRQPWQCMGRDGSAITTLTRGMASRKRGSPARQPQPAGWSEEMTSVGDIIQISHKWTIHDKEAYILWIHEGPSWIFTIQLLLCHTYIPYIRSWFYWKHITTSQFDLRSIAKTASLSKRVHNCTKCLNWAHMLTACVDYSFYVKSHLKKQSGL